MARKPFSYDRQQVRVVDELHSLTSRLSKPMSMDDFALTAASLKNGYTHDTEIWLDIDHDYDGATVVFKVAHHRLETAAEQKRRIARYERSRPEVKAEQRRVRAEAERERQVKLLAKQAKKLGLTLSATALI